MTLRPTGPVLLGLAVILVGGISYLATLSHAGPVTLRPAAAAIGLTLMGTLPPLSFRSLFSKALASHLAVTVWRIGILAPALVLARTWEGDERNCFITTLLACYFVALPLESWLLIHQVKRDHNASP